MYDVSGSGLTAMKTASPKWQSLQILTVQVEVRAAVETVQDFAAAFGSVRGRYFGQGFVLGPATAQAEASLEEDRRVAIRAIRAVRRRARGVRNWDGSAKAIKYLDQNNNIKWKDLASTFAKTSMLMKALSTQARGLAKKIQVEAKKNIKKA